MKEQSELELNLPTIEVEISDADREVINTAVEEFSKGDRPLSDIIDLDSNFIELAYGIAYRAYQAGKYQDALNLFTLLSLLDDTDSRFLLGRGFCYHRLHEYQKAICLYMDYSLNDPTSPWGYWHMYKCYLKLDDVIGQLFALSAILKITASNDEFPSLFEKTKLLHDEVTKQFYDKIALGENLTTEGAS